MRALVIVSLSSLLVAGCSGGEDHFPLAPGGEASAPTTAMPSSDPCAAPTEGCPCVPSSVEVECRVFRRSAGYVSCSVGKMTCITSDAGGMGVFGACEGAATIWDGGVD